MDRQELRFLSSARRLMMLYISTKFHDNVLYGFQIIDRTHEMTIVKFQRGITPKKYRQGLLFL